MNFIRNLFRPQYIPSLEEQRELQRSILIDAELRDSALIKPKPEEEQEVEEQYETCPICLEDLNGEQLEYKTKCNHTFHIECLQKWLDQENNDNCPCCRADINAPKNDIKTHLFHRMITTLFIDRINELVDEGKSKYYIEHQDKLLKTYCDTIRAIRLNRNIKFTHKEYSFTRTYW